MTTSQRQETFMNQAVEVLLVEDSPADYMLTVEALKDSRFPCNLSHVTNGVEALEFLRRVEPYAEAPRPDLILLDLKLPRLDGSEVLSSIKSDPELSAIPVVILTTSSADEDIMLTYCLHANSYVVKPINLDQFVDAVRGIESFWFDIVRLPRHSEGEHSDR